MITVDLHKRLDLDLTKQILVWIVEHREKVEAMYREIIPPAVLKERLILIERLWPTPNIFLKEANIRYLAPVDATETGLPANSVDYHFSVTVLEHIPLNTIRNIFIEARKLLSEDGRAIHFIDLSDHFQHQDRSISKINFLRFTEKEWLKIAGNEFAYCNRLRASDYQHLFNDLSFETLRLEKR